MVTLTNTRGELIDMTTGEVVGRAEGVPVSRDPRARGPEEAVSVQVVLTAYDSLDRVIATRKIEPAYNVVPTGGTTTFTAILAPLGGPIARIEAVAQGRRLPK